MVNKEVKIDRDILTLDLKRSIDGLNRAKKGIAKNETQVFDNQNEIDHYLHRIKYLKEKLGVIKI